MSNITKNLFVVTLLLGTLMTVSSPNWLGMWMGLEINLVSFIPILYKSKNLKSSESCMIYFLIQSLGSAILMMSVLSNFAVNSMHLTGNLFNSMLTVSMMIKLGIPPFHFWFPEILDKLNWINCLIMMTWQKIAPMMILYMISQELEVMPFIIITASVVGAISGLNQTSIPKIMGYSSISHMSWMMACMKMADTLWITYLFIYSIIVTMMVMQFKSNSQFQINQLTNMKMTLSEKLCTISLFLSLGGMPPFLGFLPKWITIKLMINQNYILTLNFNPVMIMMTLVTLFFYIRMISTILLINNSSPKWYSNMNNNLVYSTILMNLSLPMILTMLG